MTQRGSVRIKVEEENAAVVAADEVPSSSMTQVANLDFPMSDGDLDIDESMADADDDRNGDEVVREIDVYLSPSLYQKLYLLQYPLQQEPVRRPVVARMKPRHGMIELDHPLPNHTEREGQYTHMNERTFQSQTIPVQTHLCLGKMERVSNADTGAQSALHLVPLGHISQMRPSFRHIDTANGTHNQVGDDDDMDMADEQKQKDKKPVLFQRKESERAALARKSSYAFKKASEEAEEWLELEVCRPDTDAHRDILDQIKCPAKHQHVILPSKENTVSYVNSLNYISLTEDPHHSFHGSDARSVAARLTTIMSSGYPIPYSLLRKRFRQEISDVTLLQALSVCAVLVRGNLCLNSKFLTGLPRPVQRARTLVLLLLEMDGIIERKKLLHVYKDKEDVSSERLLFTLRQVAKQTVIGWELKIQDDPVFQESFPEHVRLHKQYWERQALRFKKEITIYRQGP